jgi:type I restriction-modification system DNA methylase subunit
MTIHDIKKTLWAAADKLRANVDAAEYKHLVLGLIFLKYISDTFQARRDELTRRFGDEQDDYFLHGADADDIAAELEDRDYLQRGQRLLGAGGSPLGGPARAGQAGGYRQAHR